MKRCPECKQFFGDEIQHCPNDGTALVDRLPGKDPFMGRILAGRYEVLDLIGKGGFGVVFKVRDRKMEDVVALKVFDRRRFTDTEAQEAIKRFRREGVLLRRTGKRSNNIVTVYDFEEDESEELFYFTMDYVEGTTLATILSQEGPLEIPRVLSLGRQVCSALNAAHFEGVVHRDLKLENLMVVQEAGQETVKVLDFGIAKVVGSQSLTNLAVGVPGTPGYAPPEQLQSPDKIDGRTDLFALGVVLYGLITGREPWQGSAITEPPSSDKVWDLIRNSLEGDPQPLRKWAPEVPKPLESAIVKLLAKEQEDRFQSAEELDTELARIQGILESERPKEPGSVTVSTESHGVKVAIKKGFRVVAQGTTPWTARSLRPGEYQVEIRDNRYHKETRKIVVQEAEEASVHLSATEKPPRPSVGAILGGIFRRYRIPLAVLGGLVILVGAGMAIRPYLPGPRVSMTPEELQEGLGEGAILRTRIVGDRLDGVERDQEGSETRFRVDLAGVGLRELAASIGEAGVPLEISGTGTIRVVALDASTGQAASDATVSLRRGGSGCSPCTPNQDLELEGGWYSVATSGREWNVSGVRVRDRSGIFSEEDLQVVDDSLFLPPESSLELVSSLDPTPVRTALAAVGGLRAEGELGAAMDRLARARTEDPDHPWVQALGDSIRADVLSGAAGAVASGNVDSAEGWLELCGRAEADGEGCRDIQDWISLREEASSALEAESWASAVDLAERCLAASPQDPDCRGVRQEASGALAEANAPAPQAQEPTAATPDPAPQQTQPQPRTDNPTRQPQAEPPPADQPPQGLARALNEARTAMDRDDLRAALVALRRAQQIAPDNGAASNIRRGILTRSRNRTLAAFRAADAQGARAWLPTCLQLQEDDAECRRVADWLEAKSQARAAMQASDFQEALRLAELCVQHNGDDADCARMAESARAAARPEPAVEEEPTPPPPAAPTLAASELAIGSFDFSNGEFKLQARFTSVGPGDAAVCVASVFSDQENGPLRDNDGEFALGGLVAVTGPAHRPGPQAEALPVSHTLPANQLDRPRGQVRAVATLKIWAGSCGEVDPNSTPLAEVSSRPICVFRFPGGWNLCRG